VPAPKAGAAGGGWEGVGGGGADLPLWDEAGAARLGLIGLGCCAEGGAVVGGAVTISRAESWGRES
jgi:hypothetical protein